MNPILAFALLALSFLSCNKGSGDDSGDAYMTVVSGGKSEFVIAYSSDAQAEASQLSTAFLKQTGASIPAKACNASSQQKEILLGNTGRDETNAVLEKIGAYGYAIETMGDKLVIVGTDSYCLTMALYDFQDNVLKRKTYNTGKEFRFVKAYSKISGDVEKLSVRKCLDGTMSYSIGTELVGHAEGDDTYWVAQGACSDGEYVYFSLRTVSTAAEQRVTIYKYRLSPFELVAKSDPIDCGHANDITYCDANNTLVHAHGSTESKILTIIDAGTLAVKTQSKSISFNCGAISYNSSKGKYVISSGKEAFRITDSSFGELGLYYRTDASEKTAQGNGNDDGYIYFPMSGTTTEIEVYDWNGQYVTRIGLPISNEVESIFSVGERLFAVFFAGTSVKGAYLYELIPSMTYKYE